MTRYATPLPDGVYAFEASRLGKERISLTGWRICNIELRLQGTDREEVFLVCDSPDAAWRFNEVIPDYRFISELIGRTFLFGVTTEEYQGVKHNRLTAPLAEVIS